MYIYLFVFLILIFCYMYIYIFSLYRYTSVYKLHMTHDMGPKRCDTQHLTYDAYEVVKIFSKFRSLALTVKEKQCFEYIFTQNDSVSEVIILSVTKVFIEQPQLHPVS